MKLQLDTPMKNLDGSITSLSGEPDQPFTLRDVLCNALLTERPGEPPRDGQYKSRCYSLAVKAFGAGEHPLDLTAEDAVLIKERVAALYPPLISGQVWQIIDE